MSSARWTPEQLADYRRKQQHPATPAKPEQPTKPKRNKFGATAVVVDDMRFDSKAEARYYEALKLRQAANNDPLIYFLRQVPFDLPGGVTYRCDFMLVERAGTEIQCRFIDVKGHETAMFRTKKKMVESLYPVTIEVVKNA